MGWFMSGGNRVRLLSEFALPNAREGLTGGTTDAVLKTWSRILGSSLVALASAPPTGTMLAAAAATVSSPTFQPGGKRADKIQATAVTANRVNKAGTLKDAAAGPLACPRSLGLGRACASPPSAFNLWNQSDTGIERPARCHDRPFTKVRHCLWLNPEGRVATMPRSRASVARRRWKGCLPVSNS